MKKILVIDDDKLIRLGIKRAIQQEDVEVKTASTIEDAKDKLRSNYFDLCFLDIKLPDGNGIDLFDYIKEIAPSTKIIFMSATHLDEELSKKISGNPFIQKPFDLSNVRIIMNQVLCRNKLF